jgi:hypothetical protein
VSVAKCVSDGAEGLSRLGAMKQDIHQDQPGKLAVAEHRFQ